MNLKPVHEVDGVKLYAVDQIAHLPRKYDDIVVFDDQNAHPGVGYHHEDRQGRADGYGHEEGPSGRGGGGEYQEGPPRTEGYGGGEGRGEGEEEKTKGCCGFSCVVM